MTRMLTVLTVSLALMSSPVVHVLFGAPTSTFVALVADETCSSATRKLVDLIEVELAKSLPVQLLERSRMVTILRELELSAGGLVGAESALTLGRLCGAELLLHIREYEGISQQKYVVFAVFSTSSGLKLGQLAIPLSQLAFETNALRVIALVRRAVGTLDSKEIPARSVVFLGVRSLELGGSLDPHAAQIAEMLERFLLSEERVALLNLGELHRPGKERHLRTDVAEKLAFSRSLLKADIEWSAYPKSIRVALYLSGTDHSNAKDESCIFAAEELVTDLPSFFRKALSLGARTESSPPLDIQKEAEKLYLLGKSLFERKRYSCAASYAQTAHYLAPARKDFSSLAGAALIERARTVLYANITPGRRPKNASEVNVALRLLPQAFDLLVIGKSQDGNPLLGLHAIANSQLFGWITSARGWPQHVQPLNAVQDRLYEISFRAFRELARQGKAVNCTLGFCLLPWYRVTNDMPRTLRLWQLLLASVDNMTSECRNDLGHSVAKTFWDLIVQGAPHGGGQAHFREFIRGHETELRHFYRQMTASGHPEFQQWGQTGLKRLRQFQETGKVSKILERYAFKGAPALEVDYLMKVKRDYEGALARAKSLLDSGDCLGDEINLRARMQQLERLLKQQRQEGDPFWGNGHRLFPPNSTEAWTLGGACLLDDVLWFVGYGHRQQKTVNMQLISIDTRTAECRMWSTFSITLSEAVSYRPNRCGPLLNSHRLCRLDDSFYFASRDHGIVRFPLKQKEATSVGREWGMPANTCARTIQHHDWIFAVFCDRLTALVAWQPKSGKQKLIVHPSKPSLFSGPKTKKQSPKAIDIMDIASDPYRDCVWFATAANGLGWTNKGQIDGVWRVDISPWKVTPADFPPYTGVVRKQTRVLAPYSIEAMSSALWFNRNATFGKWLAYDFESNQLLSPSSTWLGDMFHRGGPYVRSGHYIFFGGIHFLDTRTRQKHTFTQVPGYLGDPNPTLIAGVERGLVLIMAYHGGALGKHEVWLIDTAKDL